MTVADLVHPVRSFAQQPRGTPLFTWRRRTLRGRPSDAALWRAVAMGFGFAILAAMMMALALGAAALPHAATAAGASPQHAAAAAWNPAMAGE